MNIQIAYPIINNMDGGKCLLLACSSRIHQSHSCHTTWCPPIPSEPYLNSLQFSLSKTFMWLCLVVAWCDWPVPHHRKVDLETMHYISFTHTHHTPCSHPCSCRSMSLESLAWPNIESYLGWNWISIRLLLNIQFFNLVHLSAIARDLFQVTFGPSKPTFAIKCRSIPLAMSLVIFLHFSLIYCWGSPPL